jgi:hypothetical protein
MHFASRTEHFFNICVKNQQMYLLLIQFINYVWYLFEAVPLDTVANSAQGDYFEGDGGN